MSLQNRFEELKKFDDDIRTLLLSNEEKPITESAVERILHFIHISNYLQLLYNYGEPLLTTLTLHFLDKEDYKQCASIKDALINHNKATGDNIKLKL